MVKIPTFILIFIFVYTGTSLAQTQIQVTYPCSVVLHAADKIPNAQGTALITKVKKPFSDASMSSVRERQSVGIYAD